MQGDKGDRGPLVRPKVRRFVVMKGDPGPPGVKGTSLHIADPIRADWQSEQAIVAIQRWERKVIAVLPVCQEGQLNDESIECSVSMSEHASCLSALDFRDKTEVMAPMEPKVKWVFKGHTEEE